MDTFPIAYEITLEDYTEAMRLLRRHVKASGLVRWGMPLVGLVIVLLPFINREPDGSYDKFLLGLSLFGAFLLFCGATQHILGWNSRILYKRIGIAGVKYTAHFSPEDILIESKNQLWRIKWAAFSVREESEQLFMFYSCPLMYIFAKRYFTEEQLDSLKVFLAALPHAELSSS